MTVDFFDDTINLLNDSEDKEVDMIGLEAATRPTMYFIGVTTGSSSIMKVFPEWVEALGLDAVMKGIDIGIHEKPEVYREVVSFLKNDPLSLGALVTTHKIDLYNAAHDLFDEEGEYARQFKEISSIYKENGFYCCDARTLSPAAWPWRSSSGRGTGKSIPKRES